MDREWAFIEASRLIRDAERRALEKIRNQQQGLAWVGLEHKEKAPSLEAHSGPLGAPSSSGVLDQG
jgi:hypothetical protein